MTRPTPTETGGALAANLVPELLAVFLLPVPLNVLVVLAWGGFMLFRNHWVATQGYAWIDRVHAEHVRQVRAGNWNGAAAERAYDALASHDAMLARVWCWDLSQMVADRPAYEAIIAGSALHAGERFVSR